MNRNQLMLKLRAEGYPCPGCWEPLAETDGQGHHALWREGNAFTPEQKALLWDPRNIVRVHAKCHMEEGAPFQVRSAVLLMHREEWLYAGFRELKQELIAAGIAENHLALSWIWMGVYQRRFLASTVKCPACGSSRVHNFEGYELALPVMWQDTLCWNCLTRSTLDARHTE